MTADDKADAAALTLLPIVAAAAGAFWAAEKLGFIPATPTTTWEPRP